MALQLVRPRTKVKPSFKLNQKLSTNFIQKLYGISISSILHLRKVFSDDSFEDFKEQDVTIKVLIADEDNPIAYFIYKMMQGCYDAIKKKHLRRVILGFYEGEDLVENFFEYYVFYFNYEDKKLQLTNGNNTIAIENKKYNNNALNIVKSLQILTQFLSTLSPGTLVSMRIFYDNDTPLSYEAPGFIKSTEEHIFDSIKHQLKIGDLKTKWHEFSVKFLSKNNLKKEYELLSQATGHSSFIDIENSLSSPHHKLSNLSVFCSCRMTDILTQKMLTCNICKFMQHSICYGELTTKNINHICVNCSKNHVGKDQIFRFKYSVIVYNICIWRRVLFYIIGKSEIHEDSFAKDLGLSPSHGKKYIRRLLKEGAVSKLSRTSKYYSINYEAIHDKIVPNYFSKQ